MKEDRSVINRSKLARTLLVLLLVSLPLLASCDRNRTAEVAQLDLGDLRRQRESIGKVIDTEEPSNTTTTESEALPPVTEETTAAPPTEATTAPPTETTTTQAHPPVTEATTPPPADPAGETIVVRFNSMAGSDVAAQTIAVGTPAQKPEDPVREGYEFTGWYLSGLGQLHDFNTAIWVNYDLDAGWKEAGSGDASLQAPPSEALPPVETTTEAPSPVETTVPVETTAAPVETEAPAAGTDSERVNVKPELKPALSAQTEDDQVITSYVSRFLDYSGFQGTILLPPFDSIASIPSNWVVNYYLDDFAASGQTTVLLGDIEARAREEINPQITLDPSLDYGSGYDTATSMFDLSAGLPSLGQSITDTRITQTYINDDGSRTVEVTEFQYQPISARSTAGLIIAQDRIVGYYDTNVATDANPNGEFYFPEAQIIAQARYHLVPNGAGGYHLSSKTWNYGMSEGLLGIMDLNEMTGVVSTGGVNLNIRAYPDASSEQISQIPDGTAIYLFYPGINNMYLAFSADGSFPPGYVSADYVAVN